MKPAISELIAKWRRIAKGYRGDHDLASITLDVCADELEAALPASSEGAHGWQDCRCETYRAALQTIVAQGYSIPTEIAKKALLTPSTPEDQ
jgi:hypothetical protein